MRHLGGHIPEALHEVALGALGLLALVVLAAMVSHAVHAAFPTDAPRAPD